MTERVVSRRSALRGAAAVAVGGVLGAVVARNSSAVRTKRGTTAANAYGPAPAATPTRLAAVADIPSGGGLVVDNPAVVLVRTADQVHAFSAVCTHQGCTVDKVANGLIQCPCHGSRFDAATGAVKAGPAPRALPAVAVVVRDGQVFTS